MDTPQAELSNGTKIAIERNVSYLTDHAQLSVATIIAAAANKIAIAIHDAEISISAADLQGPSREPTQEEIAKWIAEHPQTT